MRPENLLRILLVSALSLTLILIQSKYYMSNRYADIAEGFLLKDEYNSSFNAAKTSLQLNIHNTSAYVVMAKLNLLSYEHTSKEDFFHTAFVAIRDAIENSPYEPFYYDLAGQIYLAHKDFNDAIRMYKIAISLYPHYIYFYTMLAYIYYISGNNDRALSVLNGLSGLYTDYLYVSHPDNIDILHALFLKSCILYNLNERQKALSSLSKILSLVDNKIPIDNPVRRDKRIVSLKYIESITLHNMGIVSMELDKKTEALSYLNNATMLTPQLKGRRDFFMIFSICRQSTDTH